MLFIKKSVLILLLPLLAFTTIHKYYVSVTQIDYIQEKQSVQIITRIFLDDFEDVLQMRYDDNLILGPQSETDGANSHIEKYLKTKMIFKINGEQKTLNFIGKEYDNDIVVCYLEVEGVKEIKSFEIENIVLFDLYEEQQNIVRTKINSKNKSFILTKGNDKGLLNF